MLTAWAVSEIPELEIDGYREISDDDLDGVICRTVDDRSILIASPKNAATAAKQDAEHRIGQLLHNPAFKDKLPFTVPHTLTAGTMDKARIVVTETPSGTPLSGIRDSRVVLPSLAISLAALHDIPLSGARVPLTTESALEALRRAAGAVDRAHQSGKVPVALLDRWDAALEDSVFWNFQPSLIHGNLADDLIFSDGTTVTGVVGWGEAKVADPAIDLSFVCSMAPVAAYADFVSEYVAARRGHDPRIGQRARLWSELEVVFWLLHGIDSSDESIVNDAVSMLATLAASVTNNPALAIGEPRTLPTITVESQEPL